MGFALQRQPLLRMHPNTAADVLRVASPNLVDNAVNAMVGRVKLIQRIGHPVARPTVAGSVVGLAHQGRCQPDVPKVPLHLHHPAPRRNSDPRNWPRWPNASAS